MNTFNAQCTFMLNDMYHLSILNKICVPQKRYAEVQNQTKVFKLTI